MIISKTPFRISLGGGGTDLKAFYQHELGMVLSTSIDKFVYVTVKRQNNLQDQKIRISYSETENVNTIEEIKHPIIRETLKLLKINHPIEITTMSDVPAKTGLGSSSTFTVGLLNALHALKGEKLSKKELAEEAAHIEIDILKRPIGKQDHYAAAFGGLNVIEFYQDNEVKIDPLNITKVQKRDFFSNILLFYTRILRDSSSVLEEQKKETINKMDFLIDMRNQVPDLRDIIEHSDKKLSKVGSILHEGWNKKKQLSSNISNSTIDSYYKKGLNAGATGGKICGAGGGGFLMFYVEDQFKLKLRKDLSDLMELDFSSEDEGSVIIFSN